MRFVLGLTIAAAVLVICGITLVFVGFALHLKSPRDGQGLVQAGGGIAVCGLAFGVALLAVLATELAGRAAQGRQGRPAGGAVTLHDPVPAAELLSPLPADENGPGTPPREPAEAGSGSGWADDGWSVDTGGGWSPGPAYVWTPGAEAEWEGIGDDGWGPAGEPGQGDWVRGGQDVWTPAGQDARVPAGQDVWTPAGQDARVPAEQEWLSPGHDVWHAGRAAPPDPPVVSAPHPRAPASPRRAAPPPPH